MHVIFMKNYKIWYHIALWHKNIDIFPEITQENTKTLEMIAMVQLQ